ncbi:MAG: phospholipase D-like domain-containing protein, partial [Verrucomicrobiales bacterium]
DHNLALLKKAGADVHFYRPINILRPHHSNRRTHRKILITDGHTAFTGGSGFAHAWSGNAQNHFHWRDTHFRLRGPAVAGMQRAFALNWQELTDVELSGPAYYPPLRPVGRDLVQNALAGHDFPQANLANSYLAAINAARQRLFLQQAYFIPGPEIRAALLRAARRGVEIDLIVPGPLIDSKPSRHASQNHWRELLSAGIRLHQYEGTMMHAKILVADEHLSLIGSANIDPRSFYLNDENNLHVISPRFAREQIRILRADLPRCREITLENLPHQLAPAPQRWLARLIEWQL